MDRSGQPDGKPTGSSVRKAAVLSATRQAGGTPPGSEIGACVQRVIRELGRICRLLGNNSRSRGDRRKQHPGVCRSTRTANEPSPAQAGRNTQKSASTQGTGREPKANQPGRTKVVVATRSTAGTGAARIRGRAASHAHEKTTSFLEQPGVLVVQFVLVRVHWHRRHAHWNCSARLHAQDCRPLSDVTIRRLYGNRHVCFYPGLHLRQLETQARRHTMRHVSFEAARPKQRLVGRVAELLDR